jgi:hypothetical protein
VRATTTVTPVVNSTNNGTTTPYKCNSTFLVPLNGTNATGNPFTCCGLAKANNLSLAQLLLVNPGISCDALANTTVCLDKLKPVSRNVVGGKRLARQYGGYGYGSEPYGYGSSYGTGYGAGYIDPYGLSSPYYGVDSGLYGSGYGSGYGYGTGYGTGYGGDIYGGYGY